MQNQPDSFLVELIRYNNWANKEVLAACENLTVEQFTASIPGGYGGIYATLAHLILAEADYIGRLTGQSPQPPFDWQDRPPLREVAAYAEQVGAALLDAVRRVAPTDIVHEEEDGNTIDYQARGLFLQAINHGIEHRTNVTTILSSLGLEAPEVDGWGYIFAHPETFRLQETFKEQPGGEN